MSVKVLKNQLNTNELDYSDKSYTKALSDYVALLYSTGKISKPTYDYLMREVYAKMVEQMIESQLEAQLNRLVNQIEQQYLKTAMIDLMKHTSVLS